MDVCEMLDVRYYKLEVRCKIQDPRCKMRDARFYVVDLSDRQKQKEILLLFNFLKLRKLVLKRRIFFSAIPIAASLHFIELKKLPFSS